MSGDILFLAHRTPYPPDRGDKIRSWNVLKALSRLAPVHVVALCTDPDEQQYRSVLEGVAASVTLVPHDGGKLAAVASALVSGGSASVKACASTALARRVDELIASGRIGSIYAFSGQMAQYVPDMLGGIRFLMDFVDMDSAKFKAWGEGRGLSAMANRFEARRLFAFERAVANRADLSLFVSEAEAALFRAATGLGADRVLSLENGIDLERYHPAHSAPALAGEGPHIVFTGQMDYAPPVEATPPQAHNPVPRVRGRPWRPQFL
ncbi:MAG TPA: glycosyltransferase, partial [Chakrabartia sp.]|nr:glycosyltransferase [Chakrabartia sp.]